MNRKFFILILCGLLAGAIAGFAQSSETAPPPPGLHDPVRELAHMTKDLKLSAEQQGQIKPILEQREAEMRTLHDGTTLSREASMAQAKSIMDQSDASIEAVLDQAQRKQFEKRRQAMQARMAHHRDNSSSPDATPAPDGDGPPGGDGPPPDGPPGI